MNRGFQLTHVKYMNICKYFIYIFFYVNICKEYGSSTVAKKKRMVGGKDCSLEDYPYFVSIARYFNTLQSYFHFCGGSIINNKWILTSFTCCRNNFHLKVVLGGKNIIDYKQNRYFNVKRRYYKNHTSEENLEVCLLHVSSGLRFPNNVKPVTFNEKYLDQSQSCSEVTIMGYGKQSIMTRNLDVVGTQNVYDANLQCLKVTLYFEQDCQKLDENFSIHKRFCTFSLDKGPCYGDEGGPVMCNGEQIGVVYSNYGCGLNDSFTAIIPINKYFNYIYETIEQYAYSYSYLVNLDYLHLIVIISLTLFAI